jgi:tetratricopeptide (TPR) repeat protein
VRIFFVTILGVLVAAASLRAASTNSPSAATNSSAAAVLADDDPVVREYKKIMEADDDAQAEVDQWIHDNDHETAKGAGIPPADLRHRIRDRFAPIRAAYEDFIKRHPAYAPARVAFGSFLNDLHDEDAAREQWEKALELNDKDPAAYNNLANLYTHTGPIAKAFEYYDKAIELNPREPLYYQNLGDAVFLFRKPAGEYYHLTEQQVYDKALELYRKGLKLDPTNFPLASELAQTYYGIKPLRLDEALAAWTNTLAVAHDEIEREGVYVHFARLKLQGDRFAEVHAHLNAVTNEMYSVLKNRIARNLEEQEHKTAGTNDPPAAHAKKAGNLQENPR